MKHPAFITFTELLATLVSALKRFFAAVTIWVTDLSWMKFFLFAIIVLTIGGITEGLISSPSEKIIVKKAGHSGNGKTFSDHGTDIEINDSGIHIRKNKNLHNPAQTNEPPAPPVPPIPPSRPIVGDESPASQAARSPITIDNDEIHVRLPPEVSAEVSADISNSFNEAVADASEQEIASYRKENSTWLMGLIMISLVSLFGIKALMGGKRRAEIIAQSAQQEAERQALHRQVAEAKMQMMQAQIEPHFLFNTLASVEHLIETDPPRASAMQRSLIQYLRAVIPQVRENTSNTNLGREAAIVKEYLTLLKMRMEERLEFTIAIPEGLSSAVFPTMMLQTLVENSIKHGLEPKAEGGSIAITAEVAHNKLRVTVVDNGLGFGAMPSNGTGLGLQNIRERLALFYQGNYQFIITPNSPSGVSVTIEIPYQLTKN